MNAKPKVMFEVIAGAMMCLALTAGAQTESTPTPAPAPAPAAAPAAPVWSLGTIDFSGFIDGYYSYNANRPSNAANGQVNDLYNFDDKTDQFNLAALELAANHDPDPVGLHVDLLFGRANALIHSSSDSSTANYLEQAYISYKPATLHGTELDFGQFVTSAGAEVIEAESNWNYSRSILFVWAIPYYHFGLRTSTPFTKAWTVGVQVVNGWNNINANNGGVTIGLTSAYVKPKYTWDLNYYVGPEEVDTQKGYRNLIDTTLLLTPNAKFNAYINYDYGQQKIPAVTGDDFTFPSASPHWQGVAVSPRLQVTGKAALVARYEHYNDDHGFETGTAQTLNEITGTYEYKWLEGLLMRAEYRRDWSNVDFFHKGNTGLVKAQSTATLGLIAFFGPKR